MHPLTHALHHRSGVFEGMGCYETERGPAVFRLTDHLRRLQRSAKLHYLDVLFGLEELHRAVFEVIGANDLLSCYVRPLVFRGYGEMGLVPLAAPVECLIAAWPWDAYLGGEASSAGIRARVSSYRCLDDTSFAGTAKASGHCLSGMLAKIERSRPATTRPSSRTTTDT